MKNNRIQLLVFLLAILLLCLAAGLGANPSEALSVNFIAKCSHVLEYQGSPSFPDGSNPHPMCISRGKPLSIIPTAKPENNLQHNESTSLRNPVQATPTPPAVTIPTENPTQEVTQIPPTSVPPTNPPVVQPTNPPVINPTNSPPEEIPGDDDGEKVCKNKNSGKDGTPAECNAGKGQEKHG